MRVLEPGHIYALRELDYPNAMEPGVLQPVQLLRFVKREGAKYPGNEESHQGTIMQEVLRALLDRCRYVLEQGEQIGQDERETRQIIDHLGVALFLLEYRAARLHGVAPPSRDEAEFGPTCWKCGHNRCAPDCEGRGV